MLILTFTPTMNTQAKAKIKLNITKRENLHPESKRNKEKSEVVKQQENDRNCNKKRKSYSQKARNSSDHSQDRKEEIQM